MHNTEETTTTVSTAHSQGVRKRQARKEGRKARTDTVTAQTTGSDGKEEEKPECKKTGQIRRKEEGMGKQNRY